jgi:propionyl-CoA carboxylase beta chain
MLYAFAEATVPKVTLILRKAYGGAYCVMNSRHMRADVGVCLAQRRDCRDGPQGRRGDYLPQRRQRRPRPRRPAGRAGEEYREKFANPYAAAEKGYIDDIIEPAVTRFRLIRAFEMLATKKDQNPPRKHGNTVVGRAS